MKKIIALAGICCALPLLVLVVIPLLTQKQATPINTAPSTNGTSEGVQAGSMAKDFSFRTIEGNTVTLSSLRGQPVIFSFALTTGCTPCQITAANIRDAQKQAKFKVIILAVNPKDTVDDLKNFRNDFGAPDWLIGFDTDTTIANVYHVSAVDTKIIVNAQGKIIYRDSGAPIETQTLLTAITS